MQKSELKNSCTELSIGHDDQILSQPHQSDEESSVNLLNSNTQLHLPSPEVTFNMINTNPTFACIKSNVYENSTPDVNTNGNIKEGIKQSIGQWAVNCNVPQSTINKLLTILKFETHLTFVL